MQFWNELEGQTIDGLYPLRRLVRSEGRSAWFETETGEPQSTAATISLTEALTDADEVVARLQAAQDLKHPNLVSITKVGQVQVDNTLLVYAVMEHIEQSLSDVLQSQALSPEEGREVAEALVGALTAIHQKGMSHGHVEAASVLATEETVKLRSDCLHTTAAGQAEDVAGIGTTLFQAFTQRKVLTATDAQINRIPAPFAEIIRNSFARRWTLAQISNALKPVLPVATVIPPAPVPTPAPVQAPTPAPTPVLLRLRLRLRRRLRYPLRLRPALSRSPLRFRPRAKRPPIDERLVTPPIPVPKTLRAERGRGAGCRQTETFCAVRCSGSCGAGDPRMASLASPLRARPSEHGNAANRDPSSCSCACDLAGCELGGCELGGCETNRWETRALHPCSQRSHCLRHPCRRAFGLARDCLYVQRPHQGYGHGGQDQRETCGSRR